MFSPTYFNNLVYQISGNVQPPSQRTIFDPSTMMEDNMSGGAFDVCDFHSMSLMNKYPKLITLTPSAITTRLAVGGGNALFSIRANTLYGVMVVLGDSAHVIMEDLLKAAPEPEETKETGVRTTPIQRAPELQDVVENILQIRLFSCVDAMGKNITIQSSNGAHLQCLLSQQLNGPIVVLAIAYAMLLHSETPAAAADRINSMSDDDRAAIIALLSAEPSIQSPQPQSSSRMVTYPSNWDDEDEIEYSQECKQFRKYVERRGRPIYTPDQIDVMIELFDARNNVRRFSDNEIRFLAVLLCPLPRGFNQTLVRVGDKYPVSEVGRKYVVCRVTPNPTIVVRAKRQFNLISAELGAAPPAESDGINNDLLNLGRYFMTRKSDSAWQEEVPTRTISLECIYNAIAKMGYGWSDKDVIVVPRDMVDIYEQGSDGRWSLSYRPASAMPVHDPNGAIADLVALMGGDPAEPS